MTTNVKTHRPTGAPVDIGHDPETGKRKQKWHKLTATSKREAQNELAKLLADLAGGTYVEPGKLTVGDYLERWLADYAKPNVAAKTYGRIVKKHIPAVRRPFLREC